MKKTSNDTARGMVNDTAMVPTKDEVMKLPLEGKEML